MGSMRKRWLVGFAAMATIGMLYQTACMSMAGQELMRTVDFCFLFDCQNGAIGGLIDPCAATSTSSDEDATGSTNLFIDCPPVEDD